jgi:DNA-binding beta-propeller fold protein YncE
MNRPACADRPARGSCHTLGPRRALVALFLVALLVGCGRASPLKSQAPRAPTRPVVAVSPKASSTATRPPTETPLATETHPVLSAPAIVEVIDLGGPAPPGHNPSALAVAADRIYVANEGSQTLSIIQDGAVQTALAIGQGPYRLWSDALSGRTFVAAEASKAIYVLERDEIVDVWPLTLAPTALTVGGGALWIGASDGTIVRLDLATGRLLSADAPLEDGMVVDLLALASGRVVSATYSQVHLYDGADTGIIASRPYAGYRTAAAAGDTVYICAYDRVTALTVVEELDGTDLKPLRTVTVADDVAAIAADATHGLLYTAGTMTNRVESIRLDDGYVMAGLAAGLSPQRLVYDRASDRLYVTYSESDSVGVFAGQTLDLLGTVPVALRVTALAPAEIGQGVYAGLNTGEVHLLTEEGDRRLMDGTGYPVELLPLPDAGLAVLDRASGQAWVFDGDGHATRTASTEEGSGGLYLDTATDQLYAGDAVLSPRAVITESVRITAGESEYPPVQMLRDTRRNVLYAVAQNGVPGSNAGFVVYRQDGSAWSDENVPGRLSVLDIAYDDATDRFYALCGHMGEYALQIYSAADHKEVAYIRLAMPPAAMLLNSPQHHLWVATSESAEDSGAAYTLLTAYDTRALAPVATVRVNESLSAGAVDPPNGRLYLATAQGALIYVRRRRIARR